MQLQQHWQMMQQRLQAWDAIPQTLQTHTDRLGVVEKKCHFQEQTLPIMQEQNMRLDKLENTCVTQDNIVQILAQMENKTRSLESNISRMTQGLQQQREFLTTNDRLQDEKSLALKPMVDQKLHHQPQMGGPHRGLSEPLTGGPQLGLNLPHMGGRQRGLIDPELGGPRKGLQYLMGGSMEAQHNPM